MNRFLPRAVFLIAISLLNNQGQAVNGPFSTEPELRGQDYFPPQPFVLAERNKPASGLAEWQLLEETPIVVKSIRVVTIDAVDGDRRMDFTTSDPAVLKTISEALVPSRLHRPALSDFSNSRHSWFGGDLGVIVVELPSRKLIIGYGAKCFYFGVSHGTSHQMFESWLLAKQLNEIYVSNIGKGLDVAAFARLSGEYHMSEQRSTFDKIRK